MHYWVGKDHGWSTGLWHKLNLTDREGWGCGSTRARWPHPASRSHPLSGKFCPKIFARISHKYLLEFYTNICSNFIQIFAKISCGHINLDKWLSFYIIWINILIQILSGTFWWQWSRERSGVNNLRVVAKLYNRNSGQSINSSNYLIDLIATFFSQMSITFTSFSQMWITLTYHQLLSLSQTLKFKLFFKYVTMHSKRKYQEYHFSDFFSFSFLKTCL